MVKHLLVSKAFNSVQRIRNDVTLLIIINKGDIYYTARSLDESLLKTHYSMEGIVNTRITLL